MVKQYPKISTSQLFCILLLSKLSTEIVYPNTVSAAALETILAVVISEVVRFLIALPLIIYSFNGNNIHRAVYNKNKALGWAGAVFATLLLFAAALRTMLDLSQFAVKNILPGGAGWLLFTLAAAFAVYSAVAGLEALARSGVLFLIAAAIVTLAVMLADIPYINRYSFESLISAGDGSTLFGNIMERIMRGGDYLVFAALLPYVSRNRKSALGKTAVLFAVFSLLATLLITVMNCLVLREIYGQTEFPFLAAASLADISLFKRLDGFAAAVWSLSAAFRSGVMLLAAGCALAEVHRASGSVKNKKREAAQ